MPLSPALASHRTPTRIANHRPTNRPLTERSRTTRNLVNAVAKAVANRNAPDGNTNQINSIEQSLQRLFYSLTRLRPQIGNHSGLRCSNRPAVGGLLGGPSTPKADIGTQSLNVCFVPKADIGADSVGGTVRPSALAVMRLMISSKRVGCFTGSPQSAHPSHDQLWIAPRK